MAIGLLSFLQEVIANHLAGVPVHSSKHAPAYEKALASAKINGRAFKMAAYGSFISAPLNHVLVGFLQKMFAGKTSTKDRLLQLLAGNLFVAPIQATGMSRVHDHIVGVILTLRFPVYLASMAVISGATSVDAIKAFVMRGMMPMLKVSHSFL